jgi:hypothetical protein
MEPVSLGIGLLVVDCWLPMNTMQVLYIHKAGVSHRSCSFWMRRPIRPMDYILLVRARR